ncbi:hypothetical protein Ahy_B05g076188 [Arachis hypogaea]|uniref:SWIM-type domain-containing protein n=1 Tax=Arachis hypogaea TaxID=3818 RepID=A0A444Z2S2_ARAHY|nr:hypothetical protein Ahy_B05g076188 [Arachis hypogaea]
MFITHYNRRASVFLVEKLEPFEGTCDCDIFQSLYFPCYHALAACAAASFWPKWFGTRLHPNPAMSRKATSRHVFTRFRNKMDEGEHQEKRCGLCKQIGHILRGCPVLITMVMQVVSGAIGRRPCLSVRFASAWVWRKLWVTYRWICD